MKFCQRGIEQRADHVAGHRDGNMSPHFIIDIAHDGAKPNYGTVYVGRLCLQQPTRGG